MQFIYSQKCNVFFIFVFLYQYCTILSYLIQCDEQVLTSANHSALPPCTSSAPCTPKPAIKAHTSSQFIVRSHSKDLPVLQRLPQQLVRCFFQPVSPVIPSSDHSSGSSSPLCLLCSPASNHTSKPKQTRCMCPTSNQYSHPVIICF